jgi:DNA polymerase III delta' subunit
LATRVLDLTAESGRFPSLLLVGRHGVGKRTAALLLARYVNCTAESGRPCGVCGSCRSIAALAHPDVRVLFPIPPKRRDDEISEPPDQPPADPQPFALARRQPAADPTHLIPIASIRWLRREMARPPLSARRRFFIVLHADRMRTEAANALLKTLEEPQAQSSFVLTTAQPGILPPTIRSRCQVVRFGDIPEATIAGELLRAASVEPATARAVAALADGSLGAAFRLLDSPDQALVPAAVDYFVEPDAAGSDRLFDTLDRLKDSSPSAVIGTFLFLHREALHLRLGIGSTYLSGSADVRAVADRLDPGYLRRAIRHLLGRLEDCRFNVPAGLLLYTVLVALRRPTAPSRSAAG